MRKETLRSHPYLEKMGLAIKKDERDQSFFVDKDTQEVVTGPFHDWTIRHDLDKHIVIKRGALRYLIDFQGRKRHSKGYHEIIKEGGVYYGIDGRHKERIRLR